MLESEHGPNMDQIQTSAEGSEMKKLLFIVAAILYLPIGVIFALAKSYS